MTSAMFNELIHAPKRLKNCSFFSPVKEVEFQVLAATLELKDSDLSKQVKRLEQSDYVATKKTTVNTRQKTWIRMTEHGRITFKAHINTLRELLESH